VHRIPYSMSFPYTTLFRSHRIVGIHLSVVFSLKVRAEDSYVAHGNWYAVDHGPLVRRQSRGGGGNGKVLQKTRHRGIGRLYLERSEEHTSELQSLAYLVCR